MIRLTGLLPRLGRSAFRRHSRALPDKIWGTKGFEFWTFLSLLLLNSNCSRLLELGSGRSTLTLAEYAKFRNAELISIETSREWFNKLELDLRPLGLARNPVHLLKLDPATGWYERAKFRSLIADQGHFDLVYLDGPNDFEGRSRGMRDSESAAREIAACGARAEIVVVDDVHRRHVLETVDRSLAAPAQYEKWFYDYVVHHKYANTLCVCARKGSAAGLAIPKIQGLLGIPLYRAFDSERCCED